MIQKRLIIACFILGACFCFPLSARNIAQTLKALGFSRYILVYYEKNGEEEIFTFSDGVDKKNKNTVTFIVKKGKVIKYYRSRIKSEKMEPKGLREE